MDLTHLDVRYAGADLETLVCSENQLKKLDLSRNTELTYLYCYDNQLSSLNLSGYSAQLVHAIRTKLCIDSIEIVHTIRTDCA